MGTSSCHCLKFDWSPLIEVTGLACTWLSLVTDDSKSSHRSTWILSNTFISNFHSSKHVQTIAFSFLLPTYPQFFYPSFLDLFDSASLFSNVRKLFLLILKFYVSDCVSNKFTPWYLLLSFIGREYFLWFQDYVVGIFDLCHVTCKCVRAVERDETEVALERLLPSIEGNLHTLTLAWVV